MKSSQNRLETDVFFRDSSGRTLLLRGVNLTASKAPRSAPSHLDPFDDAESGNVSFVNTPLCLEDGTADVHLARLRGYGFTVLRYVICWEALEHAGPRKYDFDFINYTIDVLKRCAAFGFRVFIDPHQDLFSRFSGGCGAPIWALHACGLEPRNFGPTHAALLHSDWYPQSSEKDPLGFPPMLWTTNHNQLAVMTLDTLFFAGKDFAPKAIIDGINIQEWLQDHYMSAFQQLARAVRDAGLNDGCVIGFDSVNEPDPGFISIPDLKTLGKENAAKMGPTPTSIEGMRLGMGRSVEVADYRLGKTGPHKDGRFTIGPKGKKAWLDEEKIQWGWKRDPGWTLGTCIWALHGVWDADTGELLIPDYFMYPRQSMIERVRSDESSLRNNLPLDTTKSPDILEITLAQSAPEGSTHHSRLKHWPSLPIPSRMPTSKDHHILHSSKEQETGSVNFVDRYWASHFAAWTKAIREFHPDAIVFVQPSVFAPPPSKPLMPGLQAHKADEIRAAYSPHFYDGLTIMHRHWHTHWNADVIGILRGQYKFAAFGLRLGKSSVRKLMTKQLSVLEEDTRKYIGPDLPTLLGETGIPMNLDEGAAFDRDSPMWKNYSRQVEALDAILSGCDNNLLNYTIWGFNPYNSHEWGDNWNREDLSIWSPDDVYEGPSTWSESDLSALLPQSGDGTDGGSHEDKARRLTLLDHFLVQGARALQAFCRPYPVATAGIPIRLEFSIETSIMELDVRVPPAANDKDESSASILITEIYVPYIHYRANLPQPNVASITSTSSSSPSLLRDTFRDRLATSAREHFLGVGMASSDALALEVQVSEGTYDIQGQLLRWSYSAPQHSAQHSKAVIGDKIVSIKLCRREGAISSRHIV